MQTFNIKDYIPQRVGLQHNPPTIVIEYLIPSQQKILRHKIKLLRLTGKSNSKDFVEYVKKRHHSYVANSKILDEQLEILIQRLQDRINEQSARSIKENTKVISQKEKPNVQQNSKAQFPISEFKNKTTNEQISQSKQNDYLKEPQTKQKNIFEEVEINSDEDDQNNLPIKNPKGGEKINQYENEYDEEIYEDDFEEQSQSQCDIKSIDLNKLDPEEVQKYKKKMEVNYNKNLLKPGDPGYVYDVQIQYKPTRNNDWDDD